MLCEVVLFVFRVVSYNLIRPISAILAFLFFKLVIFLFNHGIKLQFVRKISVGSSFDEKTWFIHKFSEYTWYYLRDYDSNRYTIPKIKYSLFLYNDGRHVEYNLYSPRSYVFEELCHHYFFSHFNHDKEFEYLLRICKKEEVKYVLSELIFGRYSYIEFEYYNKFLSKIPRLVSYLSKRGYLFYIDSNYYGSGKHNCWRNTDYYCILFNHEMEKEMMRKRKIISKILYKYTPLSLDLCPIVARYIL